MQLVAVYGTLRRGEGNHGLMRGAEFVGEADINGFAMHSLGGFPAIYPQEDTIIKAEVYRVSDNQLEGPLDSLEGHPNWYRRVLIDTPYGQAWVYVMQSDRYKGYPVVESGDWVNRQGGVE